MMNAVLVSIEGNIGAGKSTLLRRIEAIPGVIVAQEPVDLWCAPVLPGGTSMLDAYYADRKANALAFQMYAMLTRHRQHAALSRQVAEVAATMQHQHGPVVVVTERCSGSDFALFGRPMRDAGLFNEAEWHAYSSWHDAMTEVSLEQGHLRASGVAYLRIDTAVCAERVAARARRAEAEGADRVDRAYLDMLHGAHEDYVGSGCDGVPSLVVTDNADADAERIVRWARTLMRADAST
jgi:deoxyadenosine/deoxycytidine kinase